MLVNRKTFQSLATAGCLALLATAADATTAQFDEAFGKANALLSQLEQGINQLEASGRLNADTLGPLDETMSAYAQTISKAGTIAFDNAATAAESKGEAGDVDDLRAFEEGMQKNAATMSGLRAVMDKLNASVLDGTIPLEKRGELLLPRGRNRFAGCPAINSCAGGEAWLGGALDRTFTELVIGRAEAAVALPCVPTCSARNWLACAVCVKSAAPEASKFLDAFLLEWNQCGERSNGWLVTLCRFGALGRFVVKVA